MELFSMVTPETVLSERPPTEPMLRPWPPVQTPPVKEIVVPEFMARQSSWLEMLAPVMEMPVEEPTSKASVFVAAVEVSPVVPAELSIVMSARVRDVEPSMDMT